MSQAPQPIYLKDYREPNFWIDKTELVVDLHEEHTLVTTTLTLRRNERSDQTSPLVLVGEQLSLRSVLINGAAHDDYTVDAHQLTLHNTPADFELQTQVLINPQENTSLEGLYKSNGMFCTQCEAEGFRKITYYLDRPDVMSVFSTRIIADKKRYPVLLSNGNEVERGDLDDNRHFVQWHDPFRKPSYLFALVAGDLEMLEDRFTTMNGRDVTLRIFTEAHNLNQCDFAMASLKKSMTWDEQVYGREYDLDIFMIVAVDHFNMGAMENKGLNIFNSACVLASPDTATDDRFNRVEAIVAHEYFHNWSGNRVTCRDWFQLSLKEGFTVFRDSEFTADMHSRGVKRIEDVTLLRTAQFAEDAGPMAHPIRPQSFIEVSNFYTLTIYEKGAEVVRMIHGLLGAELFRKGSDLYFERFDGHAATCEDFICAMEDASGRDLTQFRNWYDQAGTPVLSVHDHYDEDEKRYQLTIEQSCPATPGQSKKAPFHIPVRLGLLDAEGQDMVLNREGDTELVLEITQPRETFTFEQMGERPLPSILRGFSAPVRVKYDYSRDDLCFLMQNDSDDFNRWDACQRLSVGVIEQMVAAMVVGQDCQPDERLIDAFGTILADDSLDVAVKAKMLTLPSNASLAEHAAVIYPQFICSARDHVKQTIARAHLDTFKALWKTLSDDKPYQFNADDVAQRALKTVALSYLSCLPELDLLDIVEVQYRNANNMTDRFAALSAAANNGCQLMDVVHNLLHDFYDRYHHDATVLDQWFQVQASSPMMGTVDNVKSLMQHPAFDATSPNKLRAVIGGFASNMVQFHKEDGSGYQFLLEQLLILNEQNPQIASRLLTPLTRWKKMGQPQGEMMRQVLVRLSESKQLSADVYEVVSKSLV